jgi:DNA-binding MarR family transcriptional regulator
MNESRELPRILRAAYFAMHRVSDSCFGRHGLTADQFVLLACLAEQDSVMQQDLVRRAASDPSTIRAMLLLLEGRGLVTRKRHPTDGRAREISLTPKGRRLHLRLLKKSEPIRTQMSAGFSEQESQSLLELLRRLIDNVASMGKRRSKRTPLAETPSR